MVDVLKIISEERSRVETSLFSLVRFRALLSPLDRGLSSSSDFKSSKSISISGGASTFSWSSDGILLLFVGISGIGFCSSNLWTFLVIGGGRYERSSSIIVIPSRKSSNGAFVSILLKASCPSWTALSSLDPTMNKICQ
uniref:CSON012700 protein n=1 Tax=Culicoides sonorensis TaxID=179676 RepID=A0A336M634_CULSO